MLIGLTNRMDTLGVLPAFFICDGVTSNPDPLPKKSLIF